MPGNLPTLSIPYSVRKTLPKVPWSAFSEEERETKTFKVPVCSVEDIDKEINRRRWLSNPVSWVEERAHSFLWSKQREILESIRDHRRTAVASCHGPGKSFTAAQAIACWLDTHTPGSAGSITSAPTSSQVKTVLWKEIRRVHARAKLAGRTNQVEWLITLPNGVEEIVAQGRKPADYEPDAFQGRHARWTLVVFDEACGIPGPTQDNPVSLWDSADSLLSNDDCRFLAIGNPDDPESYFARICKPGSGWNVIYISVFDTPNFTGEEIPPYLQKELVGRTWVEEKRKAWAPSWKWTEDKTRCIPPEGSRIEDAHPLWVSKVLGRFPENPDSGGLIPITWVEAAMQRNLTPKNTDPNELGVDVGAGGDASVIAHRKGPRVRIISSDRNPDTMQTCGKIITKKKETGATLVKVDKIGIGTGLVDRSGELAREKVLDKAFEGVNVGESACDSERFANRRAELWWGIRERFEIGDADIDPDDLELLADLTSIRYKRNSRGQILIASKDEIRKTLGRSPDRGEALMLAYAPPRTDGPKPVRKLELLIG